MMRSPQDLDPDDRARLEAAHRRVRETTAAYQKYLGQELKPGEDPPAFDVADVAAAQRDAEEAEARLWQLREELLGWSRPSWAPSAAFVADWFSEEDAAYDEVGVQNSG